MHLRKILALAFSLFSAPRIKPVHHPRQYRTPYVTLSCFIRLSYIVTCPIMENFTECWDHRDNNTRPSATREVIGRFRVYHLYSNGQFYREPQIHRRRYSASVRYVGRGLLRVHSSEEITRNGLGLRTVGIPTSQE